MLIVEVSGCVAGGRGLACWLSRIGDEMKLGQILK